MEERLGRYVELVRKWAGRLNLVSPGDLGHLWDRHIEDSLRAAPLLRTLAPGPAVDVGSGAGLPGVPLALSSPERHWRLLEPRRARASFLEEVVRELGLDCEVLMVRAEEAARRPDLRRAHAVATARALAPAARAWGLLEPLLSPGGAGLVWVTETARLPPGAEIEAGGVAIMRAAGVEG